jgi:peptidoglycan/xylan/chitin deacetylase (PgdA/CDA1 family)
MAFLFTACTNTLMTAPIKTNNESLKMAISEGHAIGNHTWHHWYHKLLCSYS